MRLIKNILILFLLVFSFKAYAQDVKDTASGSFPLSIYTIESKAVGENFVFDHRTHYTNDVVFHGEVTYEVRLRLKLEDTSSIPDSTIGVILKTWNGEQEKYILNPKYYILKISDCMDFLFYFNADEKKFATCNLVWYDKKNNSYGPVNYSENTLSRSFLLY